MRNFNGMKLHLLLIGALTMLSAESLAQSGRVERVRGSKAIVDFGTAPVNVGDQVEIANAVHRARAAQGRDHSLTWDASISTTKPKNGDSVSSTELTGTYGFNMRTSEVGALLGYVNGSPGSVSSTLIGGYGQYNFTENRPGNPLIPYVQGRLALVNGSASGNSISGTSYGVRGGLLWYFFRDQLAVDAGLGLSQGSIKQGNTTTDSQTTALFAGWRAYF